MKRGKTIWIVPLLTAVLVGFVGWWADHKVRQTIQQEVKEDLQATLDANVTALEIWMTNQQRTAMSLAGESRLRELALEVLEKSDLIGTNRAALAEISRQLAGEHLQERLRTLSYGMAQLVKTNFVVVLDFAPGRGRIGTKVAEELQPRFSELFASGETIIITPFKVRNPGPPGWLPGRGGFGPRRGPDVEGRGGRGAFPRRGPEPPPDQAGGQPWLDRLREMTVMQVAAPIKDDKGVVRGALALTINPDAEFTRMVSVAKSGDSGETFAFDPEGVLISKSRFDEELKRLRLIADRTNSSSALALHLRDPGGDLTQGFEPTTPATNRPLIEMVARAINGESGIEMEPFRDYRGVPVIGAWRWLPDHDFGVGTKIDTREAYRPLRLVRGVFAILFLLLVLASLATLLFSHMQVVMRRRMSEAEMKAKQLGQYKLEKKIGEGGMGVVYKAHHALLRRETALKLLPPDKADPASIRRFEREVRLTCKLTHPNTIQVYDYGHTPDGIFYYAMEFLDGLNLGELVHRYGPQPDERVIHILAQICESLSEAHTLGLIHRDIKPANVFLCERGGVPDSVKVLDFGLVKHFNESDDSLQTRVPVGLVGTPNFIAPETIRNPAVSDARSDLYALGALGYFLLTGRYVFEGASIADVCHKHLSESPIPPGARIGRAVCPQLESGILRCLEKDPAARPQSARELAGLLTASPSSKDWTLERRTAWWTDFRKAVPGSGTTSSQRHPTPSEATVRIEFSERTV